MMASRESRDSLASFFLKHKSKMTDDCYIFKSLRRSVNGKHLMRFQSETSVFKFVRHGADQALILDWQKFWFVIFCLQL